MKRAVDFLAAFVGLAILALPLSAIALLIFLEDHKSPFYRGVRVGRGCRPFRMLKFRSMIPGAAKTGVNSTAEGDSRVTRVGRWLRAAKLDELPQLLNVLTGEMSLVGPRPQVSAEVKLYTLAECRLLEVRPGMTDLASIVFNDEGKILEGAHNPDLLYNQIIRPWKNRLAIEQIARPSVAIDLKVIALTLLAGFSKDRALRRIERMLAGWNVDPALLRAASRREQLRAAPPPGAHTVVSSYPRAEGAGA